MPLGDVYSVLASCSLHTSSDDVRVHDCEIWLELTSSLTAAKGSLRRAQRAAVHIARLLVLLAAAGTMYPSGVPCT